MAGRRRLDAELVRRGLAPSREQARRLVIEGQVLVGGSVADKAARQVLPSEDLQLLVTPPYVSRAGGKLEAALDRFMVNPGGLVCLDAGASTGGFTDCLLQRGASLVHAIDVGTNQLHEKLRGDDRVKVQEQTDIRALDRLDPQPTLIVGDLSFISLGKVIPSLVDLVEPETPMLLLIKPQFEAGRQEASKGKGVISDPTIWTRVIGEVEAASAEAGAAMLDVMASPVTGTNGNVEFIAHFVVGGHPAQIDLRPAVEAALVATGRSEAL